MKDDDFEDRSVECPVCLVDLCGYSLQQRQAHTLACLEPPQLIQASRQSPRRSFERANDIQSNQRVLSQVFYGYIDCFRELKSV